MSMIPDPEQDREPSDQEQCNARAVAALARDMRTWPDSKIIGHHGRPASRPDPGPPPDHPATVANDPGPPRGRSRRRGNPITRGKL